MITALLLVAALQPAPPDSMRAAVERIAKSSTNEERFDAVTALLHEKNIPFTVERFTIEKPLGREPRTEGRNIVATFGVSGDPLVVGAHYDAARIQDGSLSHGAVDNAASSVVLMQVAAALQARPPARRTTVVWFDMEELGLIGSAKYAEAHRADRIVAMVNLDVNAYGDTVAFGSSRTAENAAVRRAVLETCAATDSSCIGFPQMPPGDDRSFVKAGVPSVSLAIVSALEAHQLWMMLNNSGTAQREAMPAVLGILHTSNDVAEKIDPAAMVRVAEFTHDLIRRLDARP